jgi:hypothetical protein
MGTSALEGGRLAIPTILLDISYVPIKKDYLFRWIFQTNNFDLAHDISFEDIQQGNESLKNMVLDLKINYKALSDTTYDYYCKNHDIDTVKNLLLSQMQQSELTFEQIDKRILKKSLMRRLYDYYRLNKF